MGYYQTPDMITNDEDLKLFRKAYFIKKTVKTTNNLAWQLYMEYGNTDQAITIIEECIALKPNSYFPYNLLGYILLDEETKLCSIYEDRPEVCKKYQTNRCEKIRQLCTN